MPVGEAPGRRFRGRGTAARTCPWRPRSVAPEPLHHLALFAGDCRAGAAKLKRATSFAGRGRSDRGRIAPAVRSTKRVIAFSLWALAAAGVVRKTMDWLQSPERPSMPALPLPPVVERRSGHERRLSARRGADRRQGINGMAAWIGAATERRSEERRQAADRRSSNRRRTNVPA